MHAAKLTVQTIIFADRWMRLWPTTIRHGATSQRLTKPQKLIINKNNKISNRRRTHDKLQWELLDIPAANAEYVDDDAQTQSEFGNG
jgi:hypothetical protein